MVIVRSDDGRGKKLMTSVKPRNPVHEAVDKSGVVTGQHGRWRGLFAWHAVNRGHFIF